MINMDFFEETSADELFYINGGSGFGNSLVTNGQNYIQLGASCMSLGTKIGNVFLTGFGACSTIVGACEALVGVLINNSGGNVDKAMERYYEHH